MGGASYRSKGEMVRELVSAHRLEIVNTGGKPTFVRGRQESHIDVTICSEGLANKVIGWEVREQETLSDHRYITYELQTQETPGRTAEDGEKESRWKMDVEGLFRITEILRTADEDAGEAGIRTPEDLERFLKAAADKSFRKVERSKTGQRGKYWWTMQIAEKRRECLRARRVITRLNSKRGRMDFDERQHQEASEAYADRRVELRKMIKASKENKWKELMQELENDIWGKAYQIVTGKMGKQTRHQLDTEEQMALARELFPTHQNHEWTYRSEPPEPLETFTMEELDIAGKYIKNGKAPGIDGIPNEIIKLAIKIMPRTVLRIMNQCLEDRKFPKIWKTARLVLVPKPRKPEDEGTKYRPLCMLSGLGKFLERLLHGRIVRLTDDRGGISGSQHGFRKGKSTITALQRVMEVVAEARRGTYGHRKHCVMVTFDVKNAFNTVGWHRIMEKIKDLALPNYLHKMIGSYLNERALLVGKEQIKINSGVPQGSVLGPLLWNIFYDGVLTMELPRGAELIGYADDLALLVTEKGQENVRRLIEIAVGKVEDWMGLNGLELAAEKTEVVILHGGRSLTTIVAVVGGVKIGSKKAIKYLGVWLDRNTRMTTHIQKTTERANVVVGSLWRIMPSEGGPSTGKRRILASVAQSIVMYATPIWDKVLKHQKYRELLEKTQRNAALRVVAAYRTVSTEALLVVAAMPPLTIMAKERRYVWERGEDSKAEARRRTYREWQVRWENTNKAQWTKKLIKNLEVWTHCGATDVNHYRAQFLTGHGSFNTYLHRIGKAGSAACGTCEGEEDSPEHMLTCKRWESDRRRIVEHLGEPFTAANFEDKVREGKWKLIGPYIERIMRRKVREEREEDG